MDWPLRRCRWRFARRRSGRHRRPVVLEPVSRDSRDFVTQRALAADRLEKVTRATPQQVPGNEGVVSNGRKPPMRWPGNPSSNRESLGLTIGRAHSGLLLGDLDDLARLVVVVISSDDTRSPPDHFRQLLPNNTIGRHALSHIAWPLERLDSPPRQFHDGPSCISVVRAMYEAGYHGELNTRLKIQQLPFLDGAHDIESRRPRRHGDTRSWAPSPPGSGSVPRLRPTIRRPPRPTRGGATRS